MSWCHRGSRRCFELASIRQFRFPCLRAVFHKILETALSVSAPFIISLACPDHHGVSRWLSRGASAAATPASRWWQRRAAPPRTPPAARERRTSPAAPPTGRLSAATTSGGRPSSSSCCRRRLTVPCSSTPSTGRPGGRAAHGADGGHEPGRSAASRTTVSYCCCRGCVQPSFYRRPPVGTSTNST